MHESLDSDLAAANPTKGHLGGGHGRVDGGEHRSDGHHSGDDIGRDKHVGNRSEVDGRIGCGGTCHGGEGCAVLGELLEGQHDISFFKKPGNRPDGLVYPRRIRLNTEPAPRATR